MPKFFDSSLQTNLLGSAKLSLSPSIPPSSVAAQKEAVRGNCGASVAKPCGNLGPFSAGIQGQGKKEVMLKVEVKQREGRAKGRKQREKVGEAKIV